MRRLLLLVVVLLVNLPAVHEKWTDHEVASRGHDVAAEVLDARRAGGRNLVDYRLPAAADPQRTIFSSTVDDRTYRSAVETDRLAVRAVPGKPGANRPDGQVDSPLFLVVAVGADVILAVVAALALWRRRKRAADGPDLYDL